MTERRRGLPYTFFRWQGWVLRSQCCRRHRRKIQTIARLSTPVVITSVPFVEPRRCHREDDHQEEPDQQNSRGCRAHRGNNSRRRRRFCCTRLGSRCCDRCTGRRWRCSMTGHLLGSRPKRRMSASRESLVSFVLFLPEDDDSYDILLPLSDLCSRCITT